MSKHNRERRRKITAMKCPSGCVGEFSAEDLAYVVWGAHLQRRRWAGTAHEGTCPPPVAMCPACGKVFKVVPPVGREVRGKLVELTPAERMTVELAYGSTVDAVMSGNLAEGGGFFVSQPDPDAIPPAVPWKGV